MLTYKWFAVALVFGKTNGPNIFQQCTGYNSLSPILQGVSTALLSITTQETSALLEFFLISLSKELSSNSEMSVVTASCRARK